jgi:hypothetical protein
LNGCFIHGSWAWECKNSIISGGNQIKTQEVGSVPDKRKRIIAGGNNLPFMAGLVKVKTSKDS